VIAGGVDVLWVSTGFHGDDMAVLSFVGFQDPGPRAWAGAGVSSASAGGLPFSEDF
jgi:hypothetical protein